MTGATDVQLGKVVTVTPQIGGGPVIGSDLVISVTDANGNPVGLADATQVVAVPSDSQKRAHLVQFMKTGGYRVQFKAAGGLLTSGVLVNAIGMLPSPTTLLLTV